MSTTTRTNSTPLAAMILAMFAVVALAALALGWASISDALHFAGFGAFSVGVLRVLDLIDNTVRR